MKRSVIIWKFAMLAVAFVAVSALFAAFFTWSGNKVLPPSKVQHHRPVTIVNP